MEPTSVESTSTIRPEAVEMVPPELEPEIAIQPGHNEPRTNEVEDMPAHRERPEQEIEKEPVTQRVVT